ncbi:MAG: TolC family protein [Schleiferiaceae bacterium]
MMRTLGLWIALAPAALGQVVPWNEFIGTVRDRSVDVRVAQAKVREAQAKRMAAFAAFEPRIDLSSEGKDYGNDLQYRLDRAEARVGLPGGIDLVGGASQATGAFINPERKTPTEGLANFGISAPLGGALIFSDRQYAWGAASRDLELEEAKLDRVQRKVTLDAVKAYTFWQAQSEVQSAVDDALSVAAERLRLVREAFRLGERSEMDTLEAYLSWVDRRADAAKQQNLSAAAVADVERLLRGAEDISVNLRGVRPEERPVILGLNAELSIAGPGAQNVPELAMAGAALRRERLATTTAWAQWLPAPYVDYRMIQWGGSAWNPEAVQWKVGLAVPLFNQKARADLAGAQARLRAAQANATSTQNAVEVLCTQLELQVQALDSELKALTASETAAYALLQQERRRFALGESTMFILATRESKYLESVQKRTLASAKLQSVEAERRLLTSPSL